ncbi:hypothetical protein ACFC1I_00920 [Microbacterium sp. NPDC056044]|uniref:hypothetical protein n=1 Tax=Microbacterium sp. NPDC056044 TaxID=3345690 RepID=UPI0035DCA425
MSHHADHDDTPQHGTGTEEPVAATRREQRERNAASPNAGTQDPAASAEAAEPVAPAEPVEHSATTDHDVIRQWAEDRHATPATVEGAEHEGNLGELRFDFDFGNDLEDLKEVSWDDWFRAFDERGLEFVFQESTRPDGSASNDFSLEPAGQPRS